MQRWRRRSFTLLWCVCLGLAGVAAVLACMHHPTVPAMTHPHPGLCLDANTPVVAEGRQVRSRSIQVLTVAYLMDFTVHCPVDLSPLFHALFHPQEHRPFPTSASLRPILQL
jgi:hypothetical protein